ncbi:tagaturonate epimerase family protein [Thermosediminibacter litoriperuensis]|uniref:Tagaturonate/fructuronate epimerase n=1 Tax=Thermosediminibacter litoriperuensis TaxID=291989 RepID=A0A5S5APK9_9FIRM|nr:tagaturonate epimerase family protein [Thermosediminibacter litoriperuensis]TYP53248.1 tagaturonate epimerase [Thermosediminibacter litoriperuensis]
MSNGWEEFCKKVVSGDFTLTELKREAEFHFNTYKVYPESINVLAGCTLFMARVNDQKKLVIIKDEPSRIFDDFTGEKIFALNGKEIKVASLNHDNAIVLRRWFPFTAPVTFGKEGMSIGLGDRLGIASPGHLRLIRNTKVRPVLAQQSVRELNLTGRTYEDVLDAASWAVFQEGYRSGFSADGDHLKTESEVKMVLDLGFTMITLDCSEKINNTATFMPKDQIETEYQKLPGEYRKALEVSYLGKEFSLRDLVITFDKESLQKIAVVYGEALTFIKHIYLNVIRPAGKKVDFEVSIDETITPTTPQAHFFVASELEKMGVEVTSLAPRFCGEFQKGIDYIGDLEQFEREFKIHAAIADYFGYRLSIHSGSDKFKVFPIIGRYTGGRVHVKTAGTNWLEALKVIARKEPELFREIYKFAVSHFNEAKKYYHVTADWTTVPDVSKMTDEDLPQVLGQNDVRQVLHITYGLILTSKDEKGKYLFRDAIYNILNSHEEDYYKVLGEHLEKHLSLLGAR